MKYNSARTGVGSGMVQSGDDYLDSGVVSYSRDPYPNPPGPGGEGRGQGQPGQGRGKHHGNCIQAKGVKSVAIRGNGVDANGCGEE